MKQIVCESSDLAPGEMFATRLGPIPVVVIRSKSGRLNALVDSCLHHGARLSEGAVLNRLSGSGPGEYDSDCDREVVRCPWHGYEYDIETGCTAFDSNRRIRTFQVTEEDGNVVVES